MSDAKKILPDAVGPSPPCIIITRFPDLLEKGSARGCGPIVEELLDENIIFLHQNISNRESLYVLCNIYAFTDDDVGEHLYYSYYYVI